MSRALVVTIPRSGTHLVDSVMERFPGWHRTPRLGISAKLRYHPLNAIPGGTRVVAGIGRPHRVRLSAVRARLATIGDQQYGMGHLPFDPAVAALVDRMGLRLVVAVRDPRDVIVSQYLLARDDPRHVLHATVSGCDESTGLGALLTAQTDGRGRTKVGIGDQLAAFAGWLTHPSALAVRFEDLVGPRGGGREDAQLRSIAAIADHLGVHLDEASLTTVAQEMYGAGRTFRRGQAGGWREHLDDDFEARLVAVAGDLLDRYGYPSTLDR